MAAAPTAPTTTQATRPDTPEAAAPEQRDCTRCEGQQHRVAEVDRMGKYACDTCHLTIVYDLDADEPEKLRHRGQPWMYTADIWGPRLMPAERRL